jgi:hypothetical protein
MNLKTAWATLKRPVGGGERDKDREKKETDRNRERRERECTSRRFQKKKNRIYTKAGESKWHQTFLNSNTKSYQSFKILREKYFPEKLSIMRKE